MASSLLTRWNSFVNVATSPPSTRSNLQLRVWNGALVLLSLLYLAQILDRIAELSVGRLSPLWFGAGAVRALIAVLVGSWLVWRAPWHQPNLIEQRGGQVILIFCTSMAGILWVLMFLNDDLYSAPFTTLLSYVNLGVLFVQGWWLARRGFTRSGALAVLFMGASYTVGAVGLVNYGAEVVHAIMILIAGLLVAWWAGFVVVGFVTVVLLVARTTGLDANDVGWALTLSYGVLIVPLAAISGLYARSLETALSTADQRAEDLSATRQVLEGQHQRLQQQADALARQGVLLEQAVADRTAELEEALEEVRRNAVALRELSTPVVPIAEGILVVPLIGAFDSARAGRFVTDMLHGIERARAHTVLLDVTGMPLLDTLAAQALMRFAQSARLIGARVILVGVSPAVAEAIIALGGDLSSLPCERDLQRAVEQVFQHQAPTPRAGPNHGAHVRLVAR